MGVLHGALAKWCCRWQTVTWSKDVGPTDVVPSLGNLAMFRHFQCFLNRLLPSSFPLFLSSQQVTAIMVILIFCRRLDSNRGTLVLKRLLCQLTAAINFQWYLVLKKLKSKGCLELKREYF